MNIDERDLHERLDRALEMITPRPAPVNATVRQGRAIRWRRRSALAAGLAAVVAAGVVAVPALRDAVANHPPATSHYTATVQAPGPNSPPGLIAWGTVNGQRWQLIADKPGTAGAGRDEQHIRATGPAFGPDGLGSLVPVLAPDGTDPVSFEALSSGPTQSQFGAVRADVSYVTVRLGNGTVLTLHPVKIYGVRAVAFAVPVGAEIAEATAYSRYGETATAIPFNYPGGSATFGTWLGPGQHGLSRASGLIASGTADGQAWSATAYLGPWGICVESGVGGTTTGECLPTRSTLATNLLFRGGGTPNVAGGVASVSVTRVVARVPGSPDVQVRPVAIGPQKFFAFPVPDGKKVVHWTAYDSSGHVVASGTS